MTMTELATALEAVAPTYYMRAPIGTAVPYIVYTWDNSPNFPADDHVYQSIAAVDIQCYFTDLEMLRALDSLLDDLVGFYASSVYFDDDEQLYIKTYTMEVIENAEN